LLSLDQLQAGRYLKKSALLYLKEIVKTFQTTPVVLAIDCYDCNSVDTPRCADPFNVTGVAIGRCEGVCIKVKVDDKQPLIGGGKCGVF